MVPTAAAITLAAHAIGNSILLYYSFSPLLEHDSIVMVSLDYYYSCACACLICRRKISHLFIISSESGTHGPR